MNYEKTHKGWRKAFYLAFTLVVLFSLQDAILASSHRSSNEGVVRAGSTCTDQEPSCFVDFIESSCFEPPVVLEASMDPFIVPNSITVTDPDGLAVQTNRVSD